MFGWAGEVFIYPSLSRGLEGHALAWEEPWGGRVTCNTTNFLVDVGLWNSTCSSLKALGDAQATMAWTSVRCNSVLEEEPFCACSHPFTGSECKQIFPEALVLAVLCCVPVVLQVCMLARVVRLLWNARNLSFQRAPAKLPCILLGCYNVSGVFQGVLVPTLYFGRPYNELDFSFSVYWNSLLIALLVFCGFLFAWLFQQILERTPTVTQNSHSIVSKRLLTIGMAYSLVCTAGFTLLILAGQTVLAYLLLLPITALVLYIYAVVSIKVRDLLQVLVSGNAYCINESLKNRFVDSLREMNMLIRGSFIFVIGIVLLSLQTSLRWHFLRALGTSSSSTAWRVMFFASDFVGEFVFRLWLVFGPLKWLRFLNFVLDNRIRSTVAPAPRDNIRAGCAIESPGGADIFREE